jgi:hypothetical protein
MLCCDCVWIAFRCLLMLQGSRSVTPQVIVAQSSYRVVVDFWNVGSDRERQKDEIEMVDYIASGIHSERWAVDIILIS